MPQIAEVNHVINGRRQVFEFRGVNVGSADHEAKWEVERQVMYTIMARLNRKNLLIESFAPNSSPVLEGSEWHTGMHFALTSARLHNLYRADRSDEPETPEAALCLLVSDLDTDGYLDIDLHMLAALPFIKKGTTLQQLHDALTSSITDSVETLAGHVVDNARPPRGSVFTDAFVFKTLDNKRNPKLTAQPLNLPAPSAAGVRTAPSKDAVEDLRKP